MRKLFIWLVLFGIMLVNSPVHADEELMRKYEPFLFFHKEEPYEELFYPMEIEAYLSKCSLWYMGRDNRENDEGTVDAELLATLGKTRNDSDELYLKLVEKYYPPDLATLQPNDFYWNYTQDALTEYVDSFPEYTYYFRQFTEPDYGYIVLQYWFFYAFNSWGGYPFGYNIHEGDWESIMLFLNPTTSYPAYVAYSAHHELGDIVRRRWDEIRKTGTHPEVFVALGSHANYFLPRVDIPEGDFSEEVSEACLGGLCDMANGSGRVIGSSTWVETSEWVKRVILEDETHSMPDWARFYDGKWGIDATTDTFGFSGPRFPLFQTSPYGDDKWHNPAKWAGIEEPPYLVKGDVNNDGEIRSDDAILLLRIVAGLMPTSYNQDWAADVNFDGEVRSNDAIWILRKAAGLDAPASATPDDRITMLK